MAERTWAERVKALRIAKGMTQQALAVQLGCAVSTVYAWEHGEGPPIPVFEAHICRLEDEVRAVSHTPETQRPH